MITNKQRDTLFFLYKDQNKFHSEEDFKKNNQHYNIDDLIDLEEKGYVSAYCTTSVEHPEPLNVRLIFDYQFKIKNKGIAFVESTKKERRSTAIKIFIAIIGFISLSSIISGFELIYNFIINLFSK